MAVHITPNTALDLWPVSAQATLFPKMWDAQTEETDMLSAVDYCEWTQVQETNGKLLSYSN